MWSDDVWIGKGVEYDESFLSFFFFLEQRWRVWILIYYWSTAYIYIYIYVCSSYGTSTPNDPLLYKNKFADVLILIDLSEDVMYWEWESTLLLSWKYQLVCAYPTYTPDSYQHQLPLKYNVYQCSFFLCVFLLDCEL